MPVPPPFASACVTFLPAGRCFISADIAIGASVIAVPVAVKRPSACYAAKPTAATNDLPKAVSITGTGNASIVAV